MNRCDARLTVRGRPLALFVTATAVRTGAARIFEPAQISIDALLASACLPHLFRAVLSASRKGYSEAVWRQTSESFIRCLENAFRSFGGVPKTLVIDNLRAAVTRADWYDPELNPKVEEFCRHYGTVILPTRPASSAC